MKDALTSSLLSLKLEELFGYPMRFLPSGKVHVRY